MMSQVQQQFDPHDRKHFCCCGSCHIMTGAKIAAFIYSMVILLRGIFTISRMGDNKYDSLERYVYLSLLISFVIVLLLWYGLSTERKGFLVPSLVYLILTLVGLVFYAIVILHGLISVSSSRGYSSYYAKNAVVNMLLWQELAMLAMIGLQTWFFIIVKDAYSYIEHKRWEMTAVVGEQMQQVVVVVPQEGTAPPAYNDKALA